MIQRRILTAILLVVVMVGSVFSLALTGSASAQQRSRVGGNALKVSPVRTDLAMDPGTSKHVTVYIQNLTDVTTTLHAAFNDFVAGVNEDGQPNIILDETQYAPTHSLKQFVSKFKDFSIGPNETKAIDVFINVPKDAAGGGYYGAVRFQPATSQSDQNLNLSASVGSLILVRVSGEIKENLLLASFDVRHNNKPGTFFTSGKDLTAVTRFKNTGNVQLEPFGKIQLKRFGKVVSSSEVNKRVDGLIKGSVLPDSIRRFDVKLDKVGSWGKYTMEGNFGYGTTGQLLIGKATFFVIPTAMIITGVVLIVAILLLIFVVPRSLRAYKKRIIRNASRRR